MFVSAFVRVCELAGIKKVRPPNNKTIFANHSCAQTTRIISPHGLQITDITELSKITARSLFGGE